MKKIVKKTEFLIKNVKFSKANFGKLISLALAELNQDDPVIDNKGNIVVSLSLQDCCNYINYNAKEARVLKKKYR